MTKYTAKRIQKGSKFVVQVTEIALTVPSGSITEPVMFWPLGCEVKSSTVLCPVGGAGRRPILTRSGRGFWLKIAAAAL